MGLLDAIDVPVVLADCLELLLGAVIVRVVVGLGVVDVDRRPREGPACEQLHECQHGKGGSRATPARQQEERAGDDEAVADEQRGQLGVGPQKRAGRRGGDEQGRRRQNLPMAPCVPSLGEVEAGGPDGSEDKEERGAAVEAVGRPEAAPHEVEGPEGRAEQEDHEEADGYGARPGRDATAQQEAQRAEQGQRARKELRDEVDAPGAEEDSREDGAGA